MARHRPHLWSVSNGAMLPYDEATEEFLRSMKDGDVLRTAKPTKPRSIPLQGRYWAGLALVVDATGCAPTPDHLHDFLVKACGYVSLVTDSKGRTIDVVRDSTGFDAMDEQEFSQFVSDADRCMAERLGIDAGAIRDEAWLSPTEPDRERQAA